NSPVDPRNEKNNLIQPLPPKQFQEGKVSDDCHAESSVQAQGANAVFSPSSLAQTDPSSCNLNHVEPTEKGGVISSSTFHKGGGLTAGL
ncbi:hypothetical protein PIB30_115474, partial [Stylosanthes scabra]|nr:hypothetical protein [Stylosanthes scabra]